MSTLDLGCAIVEARCPVCRLGDRPLWSHEGAVFCASCACHRYPDITLTFWSGVAHAEGISAFGAEHHGEETQMPKIVEKQEFELLEPGVYLAELIDYTDTKKDGTPLMSNGYKGGEPKAQWRFTFELLDYPEPERQISAWINKPKDMDAIAQNSNLTLMAGALLGVGIGDEWDIEDLLHKRCRVQVELFQKQDGSEGHKIGRFYKLDLKGARQPAAAGSTREPVPTVAQRRAAAAVADPRVEEEDSPPFWDSPPF